MASHPGHDHAGHSHSHSHDHSHDGHSHAHSHAAEQAHFLKVVDAFNHYAVNSLTANAKRKRDWESAPARHRALVPGFSDKLERLDSLISANYAFIRAIIEEECPFPYDGDKGDFLAGRGPAADPVTEQDLDKVRSTLRQFARDWSTEGALEREQTYVPMVRALEKYFADLDPDERGGVHVLVPGAGLGRLAYDVAGRGFSCQGNEFSYYMLLASNFILNKCESVGQWPLYPWIHSLSNSVGRDDVMREIRVPDVLPGNLLETVEFSMAAGDFLEIYGDSQQTAQWDCVMTCFFMDTARNIIEYVEVINNCLAEGGLWVNLGPLLYHYEGMQNEKSIELSYEEVVDVVRSLGFEVLEEADIRTTYAANSRAMLVSEYHAKLFVARKVGN